jgi:hypothetical protein
MNKPDCKDAPEGATHIIVKRQEPNKVEYFFAFYDGEDFNCEKDGFMCFHPDGYNIVEARPSC